MKLNFSAIKSQIETNEAKERPLVLFGRRRRTQPPYHVSSLER